MSNSLAAYQTKIYQFLFGTILFALVLNGVKSLCYGQQANLKMKAALIIWTGIALALDRNYWLLYPLFASLPFRIPNIPFSSTELACISVVAMSFVRSAQHRDSFSFNSSKQVFWAAPYYLWTCVIFAMNPVGLYFFGSHLIGGRNYLWLFLGFVTLLTFSQLELREGELKKLFWIQIVFVFIRIIKALNGAADIDDVGSLATRYYLLPFATLGTMIFCRYDLQKIMTSPILFSLASICSLATVLSGKRSVTGALLITPVLTAMFRKRYGFTLKCGVVFAFLLLFILAGQGHFYNLPPSVQRGLSFLPAKWDSRFKRMGFKDDFRHALQNRAKDIIRENPFFGRKGLGFDPNEWAVAISAIDADETTAEGHAISGNWHNKFYGMWADFGVVAPFSWYFFMIAVVRWVWKRRAWFLDESYSSTYFRIWSVSMVVTLISTYGQSAKTPFETWPIFGMLLALWNGKRAELVRATSRMSARTLAGQSGSGSDSRGIQVYVRP